MNAVVAQNPHLTVARQEIGSLMDRLLNARADTEMAIATIRERDSTVKQLGEENQALQTRCDAISRDLEIKVNQIVRLNEQKEATRRSLVDASLKMHLWLSGKDVLPKSVPYAHENEMKTALLPDRKAVNNFINHKDEAGYVAFEKSGLISMVGYRATLPMFKEDSELMSTPEGRVQIVLNCVTLYLELASKVVNGDPAQ